MSFLRDAWRLARPYWYSEERWPARLQLLLVVSLTLGQVAILVLLNDWNRLFYNALQTYDFAAFGPLLLRFGILAGLYIVGAVYSLYFTQRLEMRWRVWLTHRFVRDWLDYRVYYRLELQPGNTDNPDQRIADDLRLFTTSTLNLGLGLLSSVVTLASFVAILWVISGDFALGPVTIPGYMVWASLVYALGGSILTRMIGRPLVSQNFRLERSEGDFRLGLVRVRENAEGIAFYRGEPFEYDGLRARVEGIRSVWWELMHSTRRLMFFTVGYNQVAVIFPFLVASPRYFSGAIDLGVLMQIANAFGQVQTALSWFVDNYPSLASWKASTDRLLTFQQAVQSATRAAAQPELKAVDDSPNGVYTESLDLRLPSGHVVVADARFCFESGDRIMVRGPNGSGKSTLFRAIAAIWPFGRGQIHIPANQKLEFLPQRPYIPVTSLRGAVAYPSPGAEFSDDQIREVLGAVGLQRFCGRLDEVQHWSARMSGGEQQRLAVARALLHKSDWLFLDEATASLDEDGERAMYSLLLQRLPRSTIVSIAHRPQIAQYHSTHVVFETPPSGGPATLVGAHFPCGEPVRLSFVGEAPRATEA
jgi:vitamin B12/bleomycin/antimicrobial peptide transport system ATP-binding/permease protein